MSFTNDIIAVAKELVSTDFPSQNALDRYLEKHPGANKSNHRVVKPEAKKEKVDTKQNDPSEFGPNKPVVKNYINRRREIFKQDSGISHDEYQAIEKKLDSVVEKDDSFDALSESAWKGAFKDSRDKLLDAANKLLKDGHMDKKEVMHVLNRGLSEAKANEESWTKGSGIKNVTDYPEMTDKQREQQLESARQKKGEWERLIKDFKNSSGG